MLCYFTNDMDAIFQPCQFAARRGWKNCDLAILAFVAVVHEAVEFGLPMHSGLRQRRRPLFRTLRARSVDYSLMRKSTYALNGSDPTNGEYP
jgi:hypothetical protein